MSPDSVISPLPAPEVGLTGRGFGSRQGDLGIRTRSFAFAALPAGGPFRRVAKNISTIFERFVPHLVFPCVVQLPSGKR